MIVFFLEDEYGRSSNSFYEYDTYPRPVFAFSNTVRLRLSLQRPCDLALLLNCDILPRIEYLHVTLERSIRYSHQFDKRYDDSYYSILCANDFNSYRSRLPHLRTLHLQQMSLSNVIVLMQHLPSMNQLESLILVNCNVKGMYKQDYMRNVCH